MFRMSRPGLALTVVSAAALAIFGLGAQISASPPAVTTKPGKPAAMNLLVTDWTKSYALYPHPHAIWLTQYHKVGANLGRLHQTLVYAERKRQTPEIAIYTIPFRDIDQSSQGGFDTIEDYIADNRLIAAELKKFVAKTGLHPRIYLEPDALAHAIQYRRDNHDNPKSLRIFQERVQSTPILIRMYKEAGCLVYLDAAHSGWFDYSDNDIAAIANVLNAAGIAEAHGITTNVSNRQKVRDGEAPNTEWHYLSRLLPRLNNSSLDVIVDTSRNGGQTSARHYYLSPEGLLIDNEYPQGRLVGSWRKDSQGELWVHPFFGKAITVRTLTTKDKYTFHSLSMILSAPPWLDAVGDVKLGPPPTDAPGVPLVNRFRHIKPPDDCDGSLNCPPGESRHELDVATKRLQPAHWTDTTFWLKRLQNLQ